MKNKSGKGEVKMFLVIISAVIISLLVLGGLWFAFGTRQSVVDGDKNINSNYQPTASYQTKDKYASQTISGTSYYQEDGKPASTTALTNILLNEKYTYWVDNKSAANAAYYWVKPYEFIGMQTTNVVNDEVYNNGTMSITGWDMIGSASVTNGANNATLTTGTATIKFTFQGTNKKSAVPFGGVLVVEYNNTISDVTCSGDGIIGENSKYRVTYAPYATDMTNKKFELAYGFDDGKASVKEITCQFIGSATSPGADAPLFVKIIPANYYVGNDGKFYLDTEKAADSSNTRTGSIINTPTFEGGFN